MNTDNTASNTPTPDAERRAFRIGEVCRAFGFSKSTFYKLAAEGRVRTVKIGGGTFILREEVERLEREGA